MVLVACLVSAVDPPVVVIVGKVTEGVQNSGGVVVDSVVVSSGKSGSVVEVEGAVEGSAHPGGDVEGEVRGLVFG